MPFSDPQFPAGRVPSALLGGTLGPGLAFPTAGSTLDLFSLSNVIPWEQQHSVELSMADWCHSLGCI